LLSKNNTPVPERKSGENGGEIDHFFNVFYIFSPRSRLVISSQRKRWENVVFLLIFTIFSPGNRFSQRKTWENDFFSPDFYKIFS
jgi:hypothetical protein